MPIPLSARHMGYALSMTILCFWSLSIVRTPLWRTGHLDTSTLGGDWNFQMVFTGLIGEELRVNAKRNESTVKDPSCSVVLTQQALPSFGIYFWLRMVKREKLAYLSFPQVSFENMVPLDLATTSIQKVAQFRSLISRTWVKLEKWKCQSPKVYFPL